MTDKFPMHSDFPMDEAYSAKARECGFGQDQALKLFEEWRGFWAGAAKAGDKRATKTPRGWLTCWHTNIKRKASNRAINGISSKFERRDDIRLPSQPSMIWVGGRGWSPADIIGLRRKQALRQPLDRDEQLALEKANG